MKRLIAGAAGLAVATAYFVMSALPAFGDASGTVNAKVSVVMPCLTITFTDPNATGLNFGTAAFEGSSGLGGFFSITNCGLTAENVSARATDATSATSTASWALEEGPRSRSGRAHV